LRAIANRIKDKLKVIENITTIEVVGGYKKDLVINLDLDLIKSKNIDIIHVYNILKNNNINTSL
jgi:multidrug efflux pump subunit AcrB